MAAFIADYYEGRLPVGLLAGYDFIVEQCQACTFFWHRHILSDANLSALYSLWIDPTESERKAASASLESRVNLVHLIAETLPPGGKDVLDFGGGWGNWCRCALALGCNVTALEADDRRRSAFPDEAVILSDLGEAPDGSFDLINANQVLEHLPDPRLTVEQMATKLRPGGAVFLSVPTASKAAPVVARGPFHPPEHINGFTPRSLRTLVLSAGLKPRPVRAAYTRMSAPAVLRNAAKNILSSAAPIWLPSSAMIGIAP